MFVIKVKNKELYLAGKPWTVTDIKNCNQYKTKAPAKGALRRVKYVDPNKTLKSLGIIDFNELEVVEENNLQRETSF